jgi:hypothetical protein
MAASECGYKTALLKILLPELTTKSDLLVGIPLERCESHFEWPWV